MTNLRSSVERLTHFQCGACSGWWTIGDAPERDHWFCPWCGAKLEQPAAPEQNAERPDLTRPPFDKG